MSDDPVGSFLQSIDPKKTRIIASPSLLLVFGGPVSIEAGRRHCSARNVLVEEISTKHPDVSRIMRLPEDFPQWIEFGVYPDLLAFEEDLAHLTALVVLFCESPGAIAELGSFALIEALAERLLLVIGQNHYDSKSFISLGPVRRIEGGYDNPAFVLPTLIPSEVEAHIDGLIAKIRERLAANPKTEHFRPESPKHRLLAIADFVDLFSIVRQKEVKTFLEGLGVVIDYKTFERYIFVLEKLEIVRFVKYGTDRFLAPGKRRNNFLEYTSAPSAQNFDRVRTKAHVFSIWEREEPIRMTALKNAPPL
jgi:hypothetical protein